jgi:hypothetical protein
MIYSAWKGQAVEIPLDPEAYEAALAERIATTVPRPRIVRSARVDMSKSYSAT